MVQPTLRTSPTANPSSFAYLAEPRNALRAWVRNLLRLCHGIKPDIAYLAAGMAVATSPFVTQDQLDKPSQVKRRDHIGFALPCQTTGRPRCKRISRGIYLGR